MEGKGVPAEPNNRGVCWRLWLHTTPKLSGAPADASQSGPSNDLAPRLQPGRLDGRQRPCRYSLQQLSNAEPCTDQACSHTMKQQVLQHRLDSSWPILRGAAESL